jgi:hypothetical protein
MWSVCNNTQKYQNIFPFLFTLTNIGTVPIPAVSNGGSDVERTLPQGAYALFVITPVGVDCG